jgi:muramoyltetrapeptide carboxypeptidase
MSPLLRPGARIGVIAPAGIHDPARLERGLEIIRGYGHRIELFPDLLRPFRYLASNDEQRTAQLIEALSEPSWDAVWLARGGYGITRLLRRVEAAAAAGALRPKPILGFSDATALFAALHPYRLGPLVHAPVVHSLPVTEPGSVEHLFSLLRGEAPEDLVGESWVDGVAEGPVVGGNLCLLATLCGTPWQLDVRGCIVVIEEIGEAPYRVDRMLQQLWDAGGLRGAAGIAFGEFEGCTPAEGASFTLREVLLDAVAGLPIPVVGGLPIGHGARNRAFVWGERARLQEGRLHFPRLA